MNDPKHDAAWHGTEACAEHGGSALFCHLPRGHDGHHTDGTITWGDAVTAQPKPTAADVLREHASCRWVVRGPAAVMTCGAPWPASGRDEPAAHQADMLAAAGLLATAEHDAQVAAQALRDAADKVDLPAIRATNFLPQWLRARADRIAGGAT